MQGEIMTTTITREDITRFAYWKKNIAHTHTKKIVDDLHG